MPSASLKIYKKSACSAYLACAKYYQLNSEKSSRPCLGMWAEVLVVWGRRRCRPTLSRIKRR
jgi:hypothetical protein